MELPLDHVAIATDSIASLQPVFESLLGARGSAPERVESQGVDVVFIGSGPGRIELIQPTRSDSGVARFLERRGPGLHHIAYRVDDVARELQRLIDAGHEAIDTAPRPGAHGHRVAFLHPRTAGGVLIELVGP